MGLSRLGGLVALLLLALPALAAGRRGAAARRAARGPGGRAAAPCHRPRHRRSGGLPARRLRDPAQPLGGRTRAGAGDRRAPARRRASPPPGVYSSQWCRCLETARLLDLGAVTALPALNSFFGERAQRAAADRGARGLPARPAAGRAADPGHPSGQHRGLHRACPALGRDRRGGAAARARSPRCWAGSRRPVEPGAAKLTAVGLALASRPGGPHARGAVRANRRSAGRAGRAHPRADPDPDHQPAGRRLRRLRAAARQPPRPGRLRGRLPARRGRARRQRALSPDQRDRPLRRPGRRPVRPLQRPSRRGRAGPRLERQPVRRRGPPRAACTAAAPAT